MLIFLSVVATTLGAVSLTSDTVLAGSGGGGQGISGGSSGGAAGGSETWYSGNDGGYRIFLVPSEEYMNYTDYEQSDKNKELRFKHGGTYYKNDDWLSMTGSRPATEYSDNLKQNHEYYKKIKLYANMAVYDITTDDNIALHPYESGSKYQTHRGVDLRKQCVAPTAGRTMSFREVFGDSDNLRINNSFSGGTNYVSGSGALTVWGDKMFKFPDSTAKYEKRVQQIKDWMKRKGKNYFVTQYGPYTGANYDKIWSYVKI